MKKIVLLAVVLLVVAGTACANTYHVTNAANIGVNTLRDAITNANSNPGVDSIIIDLNSSSPISVGSAFPFISEDLIITGPVCDNAEIDGGNIGFNNSLFFMSNTGSTLTLNYLNISNVKDNLSQAAVVTGGNVFTNYCYFNNNSVQDQFNMGSGSGAVINTQFITATNCTFSTNYIKGSGGAVAVFSGGNFYNCTFNNNHATTFGGAIYGYPANVINCTIARNVSDVGGVIFSNAANPYKIANSIIWANTGGPTSGIYFTSAVNSGGCNIIQAGDAGFNTTGTDLVNVNPQLGTFNYYTSCVPLFPILCNSPAVDHATCAGATTTDARDVPVYNGVRDAGAYELDNPVSTVNLGPNIVQCGGSATLDAGNPGQTYLWSDGSTNQTDVVSTSGTYSVTVSNNIGCSVSASVEVYIKPLPIVSLGPDIFECGGHPVLDASNPGDTYLWSTGATTQFVTTTTSGVYAVTVTDPNSLCTASDDVNVTIPPVPVITVTPTQNSICSGDSATISASFTVGGTVPNNTMTYNIALADLVNLPSTCGGGPSYYLATPGNSGFQWTDAGQGKVVSVQVSFNVGVECNLAAATHGTLLNGLAGSSFPQTPANCNCNNTPTNIVTISAPAGNYNVGGINSFLINHTTQSWGLVPTASLNGYYAQVTVTYAPRYSWSTGDTTQTIRVSPATSTNYTVSVTYSGCSAEASSQVNVAARPVVNLGNDTTLCAGPLTLNAGNAGDTFSWSDGTVNQTATVSAIGTSTYSVTVTEPQLGCTGADTIDVTILAAPVVNLGPNITQCGGNTTLDAGNAGSTFLWSDGSTNQTLLVSTSGTYSVTVTNGAGCSTVGTIQVYLQPAPIVNLGPDSTQCGGTITLNADNINDVYLWGDGSANQTLVVSATGTYNVTVTDPNSGCSASDAIDITINTAPVVSLGGNATLCGGTDTLDAGNSGASFLWSDGSTNQTLVVSTSGTYSVTVTNGGGCSASSSVEIYVQPTPVVNLGADVTQCGGTITLNAGNTNNTYLWSDGSTDQTLVVNATGPYSVTVTNPNSGCSAADTVNITINTTPVVNLGPAITQCGGTDTLDAGNAGATYVWSNGTTDQTFVVSTSGTYSVTVTNGGGCSAAGSVEVYIKAVPVVSLGQDIRQCGGTVNLDAGHPGNTYSWSTGETTQVITVSTTGNYIATVTDINTACSAADTVQVTIDTLPVVNLGPDTAFCGGIDTLDAGNAGSSYLWSNGSTNQTYVINATGIYRVTVTNSNGCSSTGSVNITFNPIPVVTLTLPANICITEQPFFLNSGSPVGGMYYEHNLPIVVFTPVTEGIGNHHITYVYTSPVGCTDSASADIFVRPQPFIHTLLTPDLCSTSTPIDLDLYFSPAHGEYSGLGVSDHFLYSALVPPGNDTIYDIFTSDYGCKDTAAYPIVIHRPVHVSVISSVADYTICAGQSITFTATGADKYEFFVNDTSQGAASAANTFTTTLTNHAEITVVGSNLCSTDTTEVMIIDVIDLPVVDAGPDTSIALGTTIQLQGSVKGGGLYIYQWTPPTGLSQTNILNPYFAGSDSTYFTLIASGNHGCIDSDHVMIYVYVPESVEMPNTITPDGDGINDIWKVNNKLNLDGSHLTIVNRWGETVYDVQNYANNWDGTYKSTGRKLPDGTYYYVLKVPNEQNHTYRGAINILNSTLN